MVPARSFALKPDRTHARTADASPARLRGSLPRHPRAQLSAAVPMTSAPGERAVAETARRVSASLALGTLCLTLSASFAATAAPALNAPTDPNDSPLVQELLRRTEEKKEARTRERLDDYNRRNFKDYFDVVDKGYNGRTVTENDEAIRAQLDRWNRGK